MAIRYDLRVPWWLSGLFLCLAQTAEAQQTAYAQQTALVKLLHQNRYALTVQKGEMGGPGGAFIQNELSQAQFVAIGEEHGTRQVPQFVWATCRTMARDGLDALAVEAGPLVTARLQQWTSSNDGSAGLAAFEKRYPDSIAFFNWQQEFDLLGECAQATTSHDLHPSRDLQLWGLDQEFLGAPAFILQEILEARPGPQAESIGRKMQEQCADDTRKSIATGDWKDGCMLRLSPPDLSSLQSAVERTANRRAQELTATLMKTHHIYSLHESGHAYEANRERSLLMKHNFLANYQELSKSTGRPVRVLLKFGGNHLFKGFNETDLNDLGNFVAEFADGLAGTSLHIEVLGMRGEDEENVGPGRPDRAVAKDPEPGSLAPLYAEAYPEGWTVFDLRPLRGKFASLGPIDRGLERLIFGYDMLVLVAEVTAQADIQ